MNMNIWANCDNCKHRYGNPSYCYNCLGTRPPSNWEPGETHKQSKTNADRIRAMSDEELAEFLEGDYGNMAIGQALKWLKQPVESEE